MSKLEELGIVRKDYSNLGYIVSGYSYNGCIRQKWALYRISSREFSCHDLSLVETQAIMDDIMTLENERRERAISERVTK